MFSTTGKLIASLAAAAAIVLSPLPSLAGSEMQGNKPCPPPPCPPQAVCDTGSWCDLAKYYFCNRALDFIDIFRVSVGVGCGCGVNVRLTELLEAGWGEYETTRFGHKGRILPCYEENISESGFAVLGCVNGCLQRDPTEIGADLHIKVIGAQVAVSLAEAADFIAGVIMIDLQDDDLGPNPWD